MVVRNFQTMATLTCLKTLVVVFNIIFLLSGLLLLFLGIWLSIELQKYTEVSPDVSETAPYILIGTGLAILVLAVLACCCTYKEQPILLYVYAAFLTIVFFVEIGACISGYIFRARLGESFQKGLTSSMTSYGDDYARTTAINSVQSTLHCCGVRNYTDWASVPHKVVPGSCCKENLGIGCNTKEPVNIYNTGCYSLILDFFSSKMNLVAWFALALACFQIFGIFLTISLGKLLHKTKYEKIES